MSCLLCSVWFYSFINAHKYLTKKKTKIQSNVGPGDAELTNKQNEMNIRRQKHVAVLLHDVMCLRGVPQGIVIGTGENSEFGEVFKMMQAEEVRSPAGHLDVHLKINDNKLYHFTVYPNSKIYISCFIFI